MPWISHHPGEAAALATALLWVFTSLAFAAAGRRVGPTIVNLARILIALVLLACLNRLRVGNWVPRPDDVGLWYLALSGVIGLAIGDQFLFTALVDVGSRMTTLLMTCAPVVAAALAWPMLDERLTLVSILGMGVTIVGIIWVVLERPRGIAGRPPEQRPNRARGILFAVLAALCQAVGLVLGKIGIGHTRLEDSAHLDPLSATLTRMGCAAIAVVVLATVLGMLRSRRELDELMMISPEREHLPPAPRTGGGRLTRSVILSAAPLIVIGAVLGPVMGVWCSMIAIDLAPAGIAATLMAMTPVFILPFAKWFEKEDITWRAGSGALVAVAGVAILTFA